MGADNRATVQHPTANYDILKEELGNVTLFPSLNYSAGNETELDWNSSQRTTYITVSLVSITLCLIAILVNIRILLCINWLRRPLSPTMYISISLTVADTCSAILIALSITFNSLLPTGYNIIIDYECIFLALEAFRLSGILVSTIHLLALAANHYFGIICPFRSMTLLTPSNVKIVVLTIWLLPTTYIFAYFGSFEGQAFQRSDCKIDAEANFLRFSRFRTIFSSIFFIPMVIMFAIYIHILVIVRRHQANREWFNRHSRRQDMGHDGQRQLDRNLKAIWTSLLILSTYVICFMPVVIHFYLICNDCYWKFTDISTNTRIITSSITNILLITKYLINPLIYASRMQEIKVASKLMNAEWKRRLCYFRNTDDLEHGVGESQQLSHFSTSSRRRNPAVHSILMKGSGSRSARIQTTDL